MYFDGHSHFSIPLAGFLLNIVQPSDEFSEISPLLWVLLFGKDLEIANDPVCIGFATSKVTPSKVERVAPSASENQTILTNNFYYINLFSDYIHDNVSVLTLSYALFDSEKS